MKKKIVIISFIYTAIVLFSILFQSIHSYKHFSEQLSENHCHHKQKSTHELTHQHHNLEDCFVCGIALGNYIPSGYYTYHIYFDNGIVPYFDNSKESLYNATVSVFFLRGPPKFIV
jgi:hypothetical protein